MELSFSFASSSPGSGFSSKQTNLILALILVAGAVELASQSSAESEALVLPRWQPALRTAGASGGLAVSGDGPCEGGFAHFEPGWRGLSFTHAVDVTGVAEHQNVISPEGIVTDVPLTVTAAAAVFAGATPEGDAAAASRPVFFVVDVDRKSNVGHWLIESSVFLREWQDILAAYPQARIVIGSDAPLKRRTFSLFSIATEEHVILLNDLPQRNYCIIIPSQYIVDPAVNSNLLLSRWLQHVTFMRCASGLRVRAYNRVAGPTLLDAELGQLQPSPLLIIPRGLKGNFAAIGRSYPGFELLQEWAASVGGSTLFVNETEDVRAQVRAVASARIVVLTEGSAFYISASWAVGSLIVVVGTALLEQMRTVRPLAVLHETYALVNNITFVASAAEVMPFVMDNYAYLLA